MIELRKNFRGGRGRAVEEEREKEVHGNGIL